jgi:uncharacterized protein involved in exopolysaccharide biosynthesis
MQKLDDTTLTLGDLFARVRARLWLCTAIVVVIVAAATVYAFVAQKFYRAEMLVAPNRDVSAATEAGGMLGSLGGLAGLTGLLDAGEAVTNESLAILRSRAFLEKFIEEEGLLPLLYDKYWDAERKAWKPEVAARPPSASRAWSMFERKMLKVKEQRNTGLYLVSVEWRDPRLPAIWLDKLVHRLNETMRMRQINESAAVLEYLDAQLAKTTTLEVRAALFKTTESELRRSAIASVRKDYAFRVVDPPFASEPDQFVWPWRVVIISLAVILGVALALFAAALGPAPAASQRD